jgi:hypothetical protein
MINKPSSSLPSRRAVVNALCSFLLLCTWMWLVKHHQPAHSKQSGEGGLNATQSAASPSRAPGGTFATAFSAQPTAPGGNQGNPSFLGSSTNRPLAQVQGSDDGKVSESALRQIIALQEEKAARTPVQKKIDSQLLFAGKMNRNEPIAKGIDKMAVDLDRDETGRVLVDLKADVSEDLLGEIQERGGKILSSLAEYKAVRAAVPLDEIENLGERADVRFIAPASRAERDTGSVTSEADVAESAATARTAFNVTGAGVKVGVLSDSVDFLSQSQQSGDLGNVTVLQGQSGVPGSGEGTAMLEIVHDIAPGAALYFATANGGPAVFANNIRQLRAAGCDVIIDDIGYYSESPFQDDVVARAVNEVTAAGALYFASAGNAGNKDDQQGGVWEGDFADGGQVTVPIQGGGRIHSFGPSNYNTAQAQNGGSSWRVDLFWADPLAHAANDYDLYVLDATGANVVSASNNTQNGIEDPYESVNKLDPGQRVVVVIYNGEGRYLRLSTGRGRLAISTGGQTKGHSSAADAFSVAAVSAANATTPFTAAAKVETFSSDGPRRVFFNADGTPITPGNFSSNGGTVRQKPDVAAADGVRTSLPADTGLNPFYGTSAAAPHAGAIAALLKSLHPELSTAQARAILTAGTLDIEVAGVDRDAGYGLLMANLVLQTAGNAQPPTITGFTPTSGSIGSVVKITGTKFADAVAMRFNGVSADFIIDSATQVSATVPPGATAGPLSIVTPEGTATSANSFTVTTTPVITGITPNSGNVGTVVVIAGANLDGATAVSFNGTAAIPFTVDSPQQITATVPAGATTGKITVTTPNGTAQSGGVFTVTTSPVITGFDPAVGSTGTTVAINGANLTGATSVKFNGTTAAFTVNSGSRITTTVPAGAASGPISVATPAGSVQSAASFTVVAAPAITSFMPTNGVAGSIITITGSGFSGATGVKFNGVDAAAFNVVSPSQISATAPANVTTGPLGVTTPGGTAASAVVFTVLATPANDNFASAQVITGSTGTVTGNNSAATKQVREPDHAGNAGGKSIWYRWTATGNGTWAFDTIGSTFDTLLAVYIGNSVSNLSAVAYNDDIVAGVTTNSRLTFTAFAGTTYSIAVDGYSGGAQSANPTASGQVVLNWGPTTTLPAITGFAPGNGAVGGQVTITGANFTGATDVRFNGVSANFTVNSATQITATVPVGATSGPISVTSPGGTATSAGTFAVITPVGNDMFANAFAISGASGTTNSSSLNATKEPGEPLHAGDPGGKSVWFSWIAPANGVWTFDTSGSSFDTVLGIYTGTTVGNLQTIGANDDWNGAKTSQVSINAAAGTTYQIAVDGYAGAGGDVELNWHSTPNLPLITSFTPASGDVGTTVLINGVNLFGAIGVKFNGVSTPTFANNSASQISAAVPSGASTGPIVVTTSNGIAQSATAFIVGGTPPNDNFGQRAVFVGQTRTMTGSNLNATKETGEPNHAGQTGGHSVWWTWTAPANGTYSVSTRGSDFDTVLAVYTGSSLATLTLVGANDDGPNMGAASLVTFNALAGTAYQIAVDGFNADAGNIILSVYPSTSSANLYSTAFETTNGFTLGPPLAGQNGWASLGPGQNGVLSNAFPGQGQQGYIGFASTADAANTYLWQPLNYSADTNTRPVVTFAADMAVIDSGNFFYDDFGWDVFNKNGDKLFFLDFDNSNTKIYYQLNNSSFFYDTGQVFQDGPIYHLEVTMDFSRNLWRATLNGNALAQGQPISATNNVSLSLGDIDAVWFQSSGFAGNNYMIFDNYSVSAGPDQAPRIITAPLNQTATAGASVSFFVAVDSPLAVTYQWQFNGANIAGATLPTLTLNNLVLGQAGNYSVMVSNSAGVVTSTPATLVIGGLPNLVPYTPNSWSDKIVAAKEAGATNDASSLSTDDEVYISWAVANTAQSGDIGGRFYTQLYLDGVLNHTWPTDGLNAGQYVYDIGYNLGKLAAGTHNLRLVADSTGVVSESDETDNSYTKTILVSPSTGVGPQLISPALSATSGFQFSFVGNPSRSYEILASTNLTDWSVLATLINTNANNVLQFADPGARTLSRRYYRARLVP